MSGQIAIKSDRKEETKIGKHAPRVQGYTCIAMNYTKSATSRDEAKSPK